jgi:hypothetical protein
MSAAFDPARRLSVAIGNDGSPGGFAKRRERSFACGTPGRLFASMRRLRA